MRTQIKVPLLMGTLMTIVLGYFIFQGMHIQQTFGNSVLVWLSLVGIVFVLQLLTKLQGKAEKLGSDFTSRLLKSPTETAVVVPEETASAPTFVQQACNLIFIGEYVATFLAWLPLIAVSYVFNRQKGFKALEIWETILISILTIFWLRYIEKAGRVKLCTPYLPIPLKWLVVPAALWMLYIQIYDL